MASNSKGTKGKGKAPTKTGKKAADAKTPDRYYSMSDVELSYFTKAAEESHNPLEVDAWAILPIDNKSKVSVEFAGSVTIKQGDNKASCKLTLNPLQYDLWNIKAVTAEKLTTEPVTIVLRCRSPIPSITFDGKDLDRARELPLARHSSEFLFISLAVPFFSFKWEGGTSPKTPAARIGHLRVLLTGKESFDSQTKWFNIISKDLACLHAETQAQEEQLGIFKGCRLKTRRGKFEGTVIVEVYATKPDDLIDEAEAKNYDFDKKIGLSYWIDDSSLFPPDEETLNENPIMGSPRTEGWELVVVKDSETTDAAMVGIIRNSMGGNVRRFIGEDNNVTLRPIFNDILFMRSRKAVVNIRKEADELSMKARGFFEPTQAESDEVRPRSQLPGLTLFGEEMCDEEENLLPGAPEISSEIHNIINEPQRLSIESMLSHRTSIVWGPPGTGKSTSLAALIRLLLTDTDEKIVGTAMANVAVDSLLESCHKLWCRIAEGHSSAPFARIFSEAQIEAQWQASDYTTLNGQYHIDQLRFKKASKTPEKWTSYLDGRRQLEKYGRIADALVHKSYIAEAKTLSALIIDEEIRAVFCTIAGCQTPALYEADPVDGKIKRFFKATTVVVDEASTSLRPHVMLLAMTFLAAKRLVLAGDHKQLAALLLTQKAKDHWAQSFLQRLVEQYRWPCVLLDIQYRMHDALYNHLIKHVYHHEIHSNYATAVPSSFLKELLSSMPLLVSNTRQTWKIESFMHFIDVHGEQITRPNSSSSNLAEAEYISAHVQSLLAIGRSKGSICVMTGYTDQLKLLRRTADRDGWGDIRAIMTIDSSQGSECEIIIVSMVATNSHASFMGKLQRACVLSSRQKEAIYFVGLALQWFSPKRTNGNLLHHILLTMRDRCKELGRPDFIVCAQGGETVEDLERGIRDVDVEEVTRAVKYVF